MDSGTYAVSYNFNYRNPSFVQKGITLIGTAHVSEKSVAEVKEIIDREKPDIIAVELCKGRYQALKGQEEEAKEVNVRELLSGGKFYYFIIHWLLSYVQKKIGADTGVRPGAEMIAAIEKAEETGARLALIDRDIQVTLGRFWSKMSIFEKMKLFASLASASFGIGTKDIDMERVTDEDVVTQLVSELRKMAPGAASVLLDERDIFMAKNLLDVSREGSVVAVIGAGHREGIKRYLDHPESLPEINELATIPKKRFSLIKVAVFAILAMVIGLLALIVFSGSVSLSTLLTALLYLFITQGILSAVGVLLVRGHPLSALTAFGLAWFGFLHPLLAVGWLAGLVEAHFRPPSTEEFRNMMKDEYLFNWHEIPGKDNSRLLDFIKKNYGTESVKDARIEKTGDGKTINIRSGRSSISFRFDDWNDTVSIISDRKKDFDFTVEIKDNELNIYKVKTFRDLMQNKLFHIILVAGFANLGSMVGTFVAIPLLVNYLDIPNPLDILGTAMDTGLNVLKSIF